ncbi:hypothetical protein MMC25_002000 [Agyrium rufum]|nr:hypothetical protein [Agyrium rufum]
MAPLVYDRVPGEVDVDGSGEVGGGYRSDGRRYLFINKTFNKYQSLLFAFLVGLTSGLLLSLFAVLIALRNPNNKCTREMSTWSPALNIFSDDDRVARRFDGALRERNAFRGPPSPAIDEAWNDIAYPNGSLVRLTEDQLVNINASIYAAEYTKDLGGGYIAGIEVFHQLHCVNMLRQATYMDYYLPRNPDWRDRETLRYHLDHCLDMLRQKLMCDPDVGMVTYVWAKGWKQPFPDFSTVHKCRPYAKVLEWAHAEHVHGRVVADLKRAPGALERDTRP